MSSYTQHTRRWLDQRFARRSAAGVYHAHQPIYGLGRPDCEPGQVPRLARCFQLLRVLDRLEFDSFLDIGSAEGFLTSLVGELFGARVAGGDLSAEAGRRARELFDVEAVALDVARLPFADGAFDVVLCSEVLEHVEFPVEALLELDRVAGRALVLSTEEVCFDAEERRRRLAERHELPHAERNLFHPDDFALLLSRAPELRSQYHGTPPPDGAGREEAARWILAATCGEASLETGLGVVGLCVADPAARRSTPRYGDRALLERLLDWRLEEAPGRFAPAAEPSPFLLERLRCPLGGGPLVHAGGALRAVDGKRTYPVAGGVPLVFPAPGEAREAPRRDELETRLAALWPGDAGRARRALELRDLLELPAPADQLCWDFGSEADREAWHVNDELEPRSGSGDGFHWSCRGADPWLASPRLSLPAGGETVLDLRLRIHNPAFAVDAGQAQVFWMTPADLGPAEERSVLFRVVNDGQPHDYRVELSAHPDWPRGGGDAWVRLDPLDGPGEIDLYRLELRISGGPG